ncbi:hypothetical protein D477_007604 [Arthrobacter crystallopoietes BAB-32]|uniref:Integral membrane protein n=1 Tax=Arthrobacter crystallopoietes BAB-32 TaxID=1246476 RepID=N1V9A8_9MICC|nr:hypothetical protein [Arthrobacter crystallopoietes]EMY34833.1 hypothetical protein D477_007604 [Arthrobacter crystallopoietes BAB-32]
MSKTPAQRARKHGAAAGTPRPGGRAAQGGEPGVVNPSTDRTPRKAALNANAIIIAGAVSSAFLFGYSFLLVMPQLQQLSGGLAMPDTLVTGYSTEYAQQLRTALGEDGTGQYNYWHKTADTIFPLLFGFTWLLLVGQQLKGRALRWLCWTPVLLYVIADLAENQAIDTMLASDPAGGAGWAIFLTVAKSVLFGLSIVAALVAVFARPRRKPHAA